jgi:hypothetical protein
MTAMQKLIKFIVELDEDNKTRMIILSFADKLLEEEKQQIINAWIVEDNPLQKQMAEKYYKEITKE